MIEKEIDVINQYGIHARPATMIAQTAKQFESTVHLVKESQKVDCKQVMSLMLLAANKGEVLKIIAEGPDEDEAIEAVQMLFKNKFNEE